MMSITGTPETGPLKSGSTIVDYTTGYAAALGIAIALFQRTRTGEGQAIDVAMLETAMTMMGGEVLRAITANETPPLVGNASGKGGYVSDTYRCKEGHLSIAAGAPARREKLWKAIDATEIPQDPRFATDAAVAKNMKALNEAIERKLSTKTAAEWEAILNKAGVAAMEVLPLARAVHHPQLEHRKFFHKFDDTEATGLPPFAVPTSPYRLSASPATDPFHAAAPGAAHRRGAGRARVFPRRKSRGCAPPASCSRIEPHEKIRRRADSAIVYTAITSYSRSNGQFPGGGTVMGRGIERRRALALAIVAAVWAWPGASWAQTFPTKTVRYVVPFGAGGSPDLVARILTERLTRLWGQQVIVDNRVGVAGVLGTAFVAKSPPDGHTLVQCNVASSGIGVSLFAKMPYDQLRDIAAVTRIGMTPNIIIVHPSMPVKTLKQLIAYARAQPGQAELCLRARRHVAAALDGAAQADGEDRHREHPVQDRRAGHHRQHRRPGSGRHLQFPGVGGAGSVGTPAAARGHDARRASRSFPTCRRCRSRDFPASKSVRGRACARRPQRPRRCSTS